MTSRLSECFYIAFAMPAFASSGRKDSWEIRYPDSRRDHNTWGCGVILCFHYREGGWVPGSGAVENGRFKSKKIRL